MLLLLSIVGYYVIAFVFFINQRYVLPIIAPEIMLFLGVVFPTLEQAVSQELEKRRVRNFVQPFHFS